MRMNGVPDVYANLAKSTLAWRTIALVAPYGWLPRVSPERELCVATPFATRWVGDSVRST
eukprot:244659-Chlamydomonas_euryale.AAC.1